MPFDHAAIAQKAATSALIAADDTALFFYDLGRLEQILRTVADSFGPARQSVAIKTCPIPTVLNFIVQHGFALEAASIEEVRLARDPKVGARHIIFDSPVKTRQEIDEVASHALVLRNCNSLEELDRIPQNVQCQVGLRLNPLANLDNPDQFNVSTADSKFGVPLSDLERIETALTSHEWLTQILATTHL